MGLPGITALRTRIASLQPRIASAGELQAQQLQSVAITALEGHKKHLADYRVQAQLALAQLYDRASSAAEATP